MQIFSKKEAVNVGWELTKTNLGFLIIMYVIYLGVSVVIGGLQGVIEGFIGKGLLSFNITIISFFLSLLLTLGMIKIFLDLYDGKKGELSDLFSSYEKYFDYLLCSLLVALIIVGGVILLIVPGIIWALKYQFAPYLIVDKKMKAIDAIKLSGKITYGHKINLFLLALLVIGIMIQGFFACCIGVIPAGFIANFAYIHVYRKLLADYESANQTNIRNSVAESPVTPEETAVLAPENTENSAPIEEPKTPENPVPPAQ